MSKHTMIIIKQRRNTSERREKTMLVGVTGPSGAGKSLAVGVFEAHGFRVIDADLIAREVVLPGQPVLLKLAAEFGSDIIRADGTLDRRRLAERAFSSRKRTDRMNAVMHPEIRKRMAAQAADYAAAGEDCLFDAPLLFEAGLETLCDCCVAVVAPMEVRLERLSRRDGLTRQEILSRLNRQHEDEYYTSRCQYVIVNNSDADAMRRETEKVIALIRENRTT